MQAALPASERSSPTGQRGSRPAAIPQYPEDLHDPRQLIVSVLLGKSQPQGGADRRRQEGDPALEEG